MKYFAIAFFLIVAVLFVIAIQPVKNEASKCYELKTGSEENQIEYVKEINCN